MSGFNNIVGLQRSSYAYNERGWLKSSSSKEFSMELKYQDGTSPQWNGNISNQLWGKGVNLPNKFTYSYDGLNRLNAAVSTGVVMSENLSYDVMGNISQLIRDGAAGYYSYNGNRLSKIDGALATGNYSYDANGNATVDGRNGMNLTYNVLNLPQTASKSGLSLAYTYDGRGKKLRKLSSSGDRDDYAGGIQYKNEVIEFIQTSEGVARNNNGVYSYEYNLSDHLGNVRYTFNKHLSSGDLQTLQEDNYYAFGLRKLVQEGTNKYLYNGKELQQELGQYDYGARFYDPVIGRFSTVDPLADEFEHLSPYNYAMNNPVLMIDPTGMAADSSKVDPPNKPVQLKEVEIKGWRWPTWTFTIPVVGAAAESGNNLSDGNYGTSAAKFGQALLELFTLGYAYEAKAGATIATKTGTTVYTSVTTEGVTQYVGITNNLARRAAQHLASKGINIQPLMKGLSRTDARAVEQALIEIHGLGKNPGGTLLNKINSIATSNPSYGAQIQRGYELLKSIGYK